MDYQRLRVSRGPGNARSAAAYRLLAPHLAPATRGDANHRHKSAPHPGFLPTKAIRICDHARHVSPAVRATPRRPIPAATDYRPSPPALARHAAHIPLKAHSPRPRGSDAIDPRVVGCARTDQYAPTKSHVQAFAEGPHAELLAGRRGALRWRPARCTTAPPPRGRTDHEIGRQIPGRGCHVRLQPWDTARWLVSGGRAKFLTASLATCRRLRTLVLSPVMEPMRTLAEP